MNDATEFARVGPQQRSEAWAEGRSALDRLVRDAAAKMLAAALEAEVDEFLAAHDARRDERGHRLVVRNGHLPARTVLTGAGPLPVQAPRVRDRGPPESRVAFTSTLLPKYLRKSKTVEELIPWLYLMGVSTNGMGEGLQTLLGPGAGGLSPNVVSRLTTHWQQEQAEWSKRSLAGKEYVYLWVDGLGLNVRLGDDDRQCLLVVIGALPDGAKELVALWDGHRESAPAWAELLRDLKARGFTKLPKVAVGDGALGFWSALREVYDERVAEQRCTVHKTANVLGQLPTGQQAKAKGLLNDIWQAPTRTAAEAAFDTFLRTFEAKYPKAATCLSKDRAALLAYYAFPAEHWKHLRTTNPIESTFGTVRQRHRRTKGSGSRAASLAMVFKLAQQAEKHWRKLDGAAQLPLLLAGRRFLDGELQAAA